MKRPRFQPPAQRKAHKVPHECHVVCGPVFLLPALLHRCFGGDRDPRMRIAGRWLPYVRASHRLYVSRGDRALSPPLSPRLRKLARIAQFTGADRAYPF